VKSIKEQGAKELWALKNRVIKSFGLERISRDAFENFMDKIGVLEKDIEKLEELDEEVPYAT